MPARPKSSCWCTRRLRSRLAVLQMQSVVRQIPCLSRSTAALQQQIQAYTMVFYLEIRDKKDVVLEMDPDLVALLTNDKVISISLHLSRYVPQVLKAFLSESQQKSMLAILERINNTSIVDSKDAKKKLAPLVNALKPLVEALNASFIAFNTDRQRAFVDVKERRIGKVRAWAPHFHAFALVFRSSSMAQGLARAGMTVSICCFHCSQVEVVVSDSLIMRAAHRNCCQDQGESDKGEGQLLQ